MKKNLLYVLAVVITAVFMSMTAAEANNPVLQQDKLKDIGDRLIETFYLDFAAQKIPVLPRDITNEKISGYYLLYFQDASYDSGGSVFAKQNVEFNFAAGEATISKSAADETARLFGRENTDLREYLSSDYSVAYDVSTDKYTVKPANFWGYHNKNKFDYTLDNIDVSGDTAIVSYNTYYTDDYNKFWQYADDFMSMPGWDFTVKAGIYKMHFRVIDGYIVLEKTEFEAKPDFRFYTQ